jgi:hypothetical protein
MVRRAWQWRLIVDLGIAVAAACFPLIARTVKRVQDGR